MAALTSTGTSLGQVDLHDKFHTFINGTKGWSVNDYSVDGSGKRMHIQKTLTSSTVYMNIRSMVNEKLPNQGSTVSPLQYLKGFCGYLSTSYDSGADFWSQADAPPLYSDVPQGSFINVSESSASYRFVADDDFISITVIDELGYYQHLVVSTVEGLIGCFASNSYRELQNSGNEWYQRRCFLRVNFTGSPAPEYWGCVLAADTSTRKMQNQWGSGDVTDIIIGNFYQGVNSSQVGLSTQEILSQSPSPTVGIPVLLPFTIFSRGTVAGGFSQFDGVSGIKFLNKKYINDGDTITVGGVDYVVYTANYDLPNYGIAFKVS